MKILKHFTAPLALLIFMSSCRAPKDLEFKEYNNLTLDKLGFSASALTLNLVYYNPNNFGMELNRTELDIYVDSTFLGHSSQLLQVPIPRRDVFTIPLRVELDMKNLFKNGLTSLFNKEVAIRTIGSVKVGKAGVYKNIKVDYTTRQQLSFF
ncbi:MAG TPA: LEA type 2 family protein [Ferruginibacter sp.]|nr:LEA type 2 family protein [Ferruginibacter sp.]